MVAIVDTRSDYTTCHRDMPALLAAVRRGVLQGGALPLTLPTLSLGEILISPTSMLYRNLLAMETEEALTAYPMDAAVLLGGCDKTVPAQLMAAASADVPVVSVVTGPMRTGSWRGTRLGACTDCRAHWLQYRAGELDDSEIREVQQELCPTGGTCMVMGTASTMACLTEALGLMLPGGAAAPSSSGARLRHAVASGRRAAALARNPIRPRQVLTAAAFANAVTVLLAIGGSTNAIIHLLAIARRAGVPLTLADFEVAAARVPLLVNCKPSGGTVAGGPAPCRRRAGGARRVAPDVEPRRALRERANPWRATRGAAGLGCGSRGDRCRREHRPRSRLGRKRALTTRPVYRARAGHRYPERADRAAGGAHRVARFAGARRGGAEALRGHARPC